MLHSSQRQKGSCFEYDCHASLLQKFPDAYLTKQRGFQLMYDIQTDQGRTVFECKRLKGISWNELVKLHKKLMECRPFIVGLAPYNAFILFKSNRQPCLVFDGESICTFESHFQVPFIDHPPVQRRKS